MPSGPTEKGRPIGIPQQQIISGGALRMYRCRAVRDNYLIVSQYAVVRNVAGTIVDVTVSDVIEYIAKYPGLWELGWDQATFTMHLGTYFHSYSATSAQKRVVTDTANGFVETQVPVPAWEPKVTPVFADYPIDVVVALPVINGTEIIATVEHIVDGAFVDTLGTDGLALTTSVTSMQMGPAYWAREN